jgi:hypothetical protein
MFLERLFFAGIVSSPFLGVNAYCSHNPERTYQGDVPYRGIF